MTCHYGTNHSPTTGSPALFPCRPTSWYTKYVKRGGGPKQAQQAKSVPNNETLLTSKEPQTTKEYQLPPISLDLFSKRPSHQPQSPFCSRLPREIRLEIFKYLLSGNYFHLRYGDGKVRPYICRHPCLLASEGVHGHDTCWNQYYPSSKQPYLSAVLSSNFLPLLQACRHV